MKSGSSRWWMYVLRCADDSLYTGITTDLERRCAEHQAGTGARYTRARLPVQVVGRWPYPDRSRASRAEAAFKKLRRGDKLRFLGDPPAWIRSGNLERAGAVDSGSPSLVPPDSTT